MPGPQKGNPYGPRHNENCVPMVILKDQGGYGIATCGRSNPPKSNATGLSDTSMRMMMSASMMNRRNRAR